MCRVGDGNVWQTVCQTWLARTERLDRINGAMLSAVLLAAVTSSSTLRLSASWRSSMHCARSTLGFLGPTTHARVPRPNKINQPQRQTSTDFLSLNPTIITHPFQLQNYQLDIHRKLTIHPLKWKGTKEIRTIENFSKWKSIWIASSLFSSLRTLSRKEIIILYIC